MIKKIGKMGKMTLLLKEDKEKGVLFLSVSHTHHANHIVFMSQ